MKKATKLLSAALGLVMSTSLVATAFAGCGGDNNTTAPAALVIMSDAVDGLFNPYYATSGADMEVVGMTQIGMLTTGFTGNPGEEQATVEYGDDEPVVVKDYEIVHDANETNENKDGNGVTTYRFVIKNGIKFSDGHPLTMEDVLFNMYVYLDPVYAGSSTMYSTDIVGLKQYRTQSTVGSAGDAISSEATTRAKNRINELTNIYTALKNANKPTHIDAMKEAISTHSVSKGYKEAVAYGSAREQVTNAQLLKDYEYALETFKKELETDYETAKESYTEEPYASNGFDEITSFMYMEGYVDLEYEKKVLSNGKETDDKSKIKKVTRNYLSTIKTKEEAVNYVFEAKVESELNIILSYWATGNTLRNEFSSNATEVILHENLKEGELAVPNISGIRSIAHTADAPDTMKINGTDYKVAQAHNNDGTVVAPDEYDILEIKINGIDPKAIWNFGFTVAPQHYYAPNQEVNIVGNKFGVEWGSFDFMKNEIQSTRNVKVPMGAGPYVATDANNNDNPDGNSFNKDNVIYFKANETFLLGKPKTEKIRYQVVSSNNALDVLQQDSVHFVTPQFTRQNNEKIAGMQGVESVDSWQLGYGYIGINAGKVQNINLRKAIMSAMDVSLAMQYYGTGQAKTIAWPMSTVSWAYPKDAMGAEDKNNGHDYTQFPKGADADAQAMAKIEQYMQMAGATKGDSRLKMQFTIAGSNLTEHPTYLTFNHAAELLNACGWDVEVIPDVNALNKLSTGALTVWAAAWGSTIDPDMYQVYHKNSTATSTVAWGYRAIKENPSSYSIETNLINQLSVKIDAGRKTNDQAERSKIYKEAMSLVLDLAVEMPVYQRKTLYAYNSNVIKTSSLPAVVNPCVQ